MYWRSNTHTQPYKRTRSSICAHVTTWWMVVLYGGCDFFVSSFYFYFYWQNVTARLKSVVNVRRIRRTRGMQREKEKYEVNEITPQRGHVISLPVTISDNVLILLGIIAGHWERRTFAHIGN